MKLFSRKGIVAAAASAALVSGAFAAPAMAEPTTTQASSVQILAAENTDNGSLANLSSIFTDAGDNDDGTSEGSSVEEFGDWIGVFSAVIGALSALFGFIALF